MRKAIQIFLDLDMKDIEEEEQISIREETIPVLTSFFSKIKKNGN